MKKKPRVKKNPPPTDSAAGNTRKRPKALDTSNAPSFSLDEAFRKMKGMMNDLERPNTPDTKTLLDLEWNQLRRQLGALEVAAESDIGSYIGFLRNIGNHVCGELKSLIEREPNIALKNIRASTAWPVLLVQNPDVNETIVKTITKDLGLGLDTEYPAHLYKYSRKRDVLQEICFHLFLLTRLLKVRSLAKTSRSKIDPLDFPMELLESNEPEVYFPALRLFRRFAAVRNNVEDSDITFEQYLSLLFANIKASLKIDRDIPDAIIAELTDAASKLPEPLLAADCARLMKPLILALTDGAPEKNKVLRPLGLYRQPHYNEKPALRGKDRPGPKKTRESDIRDGIFTKINAMLKRILREAKAESIGT